MLAGVMDWTKDFNDFSYSYLFQRIILRNPFSKFISSISDKKTLMLIGLFLTFILDKTIKYKFQKKYHKNQKINNFSFEFKIIALMIYVLISNQLITRMDSHVLQL